MSFKKLLDAEINESPVGQKGRTSSVDADNYIDENPKVVNDFKKIVQKMGGKQVARRILDRMSFTNTKRVVAEGISDVEEYLRDVGFKIKAIHPTKEGKELEFYKDYQAEEAFEDLKSAGFLDSFNLDLQHNIIVVVEL